MKTIYKILPFEKLKLETSLSKDEILKRLADNIESGIASRNWFTGSSSSSKYFEGNLYENGFRISRIITGRNSFLPEIHGKIEELRFGVTLELTLRMNVIAIIISTLWFAGVFVACISMIGVYLSSSSEGDSSAFIPFVMLIFGGVIVVGSFKYQSIAARKYLMQILEASLSNDSL